MSSASPEPAGSSSSIGDCRRPPGRPRPSSRARKSRGAASARSTPAPRDARIASTARAKRAPGPVETLLNAIATCSSLDVIDIIAKRKTPVERLVGQDHRRTGGPTIRGGSCASRSNSRSTAPRSSASTRSGRSTCRSSATARSPASLAPDIVAETRLTLNGESRRSGSTARLDARRGAEPRATRRLRRFDADRWATRRREARVERVRHELLLHQPAPAEQTRAHRPDRHAKHLGGGLVRLILDVDDDRASSGMAREPSPARRRSPARDRAARRCSRRCRATASLWSEPTQGEIDVAGLELHHRPRALARAEKHVSADREQPAATVAPRQVRVPRPERAEKGVLHDVVGIGLVARQRERETIDVVDPRNRLALERDGLSPKALAECIAR